MANFMERFKEYLKFDEEYLGGPHKVYKFPNNYGASVVQNDYSYGGEREDFEKSRLYILLMGMNGILIIPHLLLTMFWGI